MTEELLREYELRRADFVDGTPVTLADGQQWILRNPLVIFEAHDESDTGWRSSLTLEGRDDYQSLLDRRKEMFASTEDGMVKLADAASVELPIARALLTANYDLTSAQLNKLLRFIYDDPSGRHPLARLRDDVMGVATGVGPKHSPDGSDSADSPSEGSPATEG
ncbi:hypothetical protein [Singulisphaera sp. PoT]|uniref:hypothetical protein n=1 Tax=Singulisphaera sp. PoT TaxID=3411797 RepID=UPI003BF5BA71